MRSMPHILIAFMVVMAVVMPQSSHAQDVESYKYDIGGAIGFSGYLGDANESNLLKHPGFSMAAVGHYLIDSRWSLRAQLGYRTLSGNTADFENKLPGGANYKFTASVYDLGVRGEVNFFGYGIGETYKRLRRWTPYLGLGLGVSVSACGGKTAAGLNIPMAVGVRYKLKPRVNLFAEFVMTKTFSDKIDGPQLNDLYQIKSSFIKNTDWYSDFLVGITFEFGPRCTVCHRID